MLETTRNLQTQTTATFSDSPIWVRPAEACRLAGIGLTKLYELIADGTIESRTLGRARLIRRLDLERLGEG
jgi:excisionase family DNA binding protein